MARPADPWCPSAPTHSPGAVVFALVAGAADAPRAAYLDTAQALDPAWLAMAAPLAPGEVLRIAAPCARTGCGHFDGGADRCRLVDDVVQQLPVVVHRLPRCAIRTHCVWWRHEGAQACQRCPQVVTEEPVATSAMRHVPRVLAAAAAARATAALAASATGDSDVRFSPVATSDPG